MTPTDRPTTFGLTTQEWQPDPIGAYLPAAAVHGEGEFDLHYDPHCSRCNEQRDRLRPEHGMDAIYTEVAAETACELHIHVAGRSPNDRDHCEACGHDLRERCHVRAALRAEEEE